MYMYIYIYTHNNPAGHAPLPPARPGQLRHGQQLRVQQLQHTNTNNSNFI